MTALKSLILAGVTLAISAGVAALADEQTGSAELPPDVTAFVSRSTSCSEWSKKAIDPAEWTAQIEAIYSNLQSLKCFDIMDDARALRQKYAGNPEILASLGADHTFTRFVTRLPARIAVPPALDR
jgi:hypothetical protein